MATKTANPQLLQAIVRGIGERYLETLGFRRTGCTLRREVEPGFLHIIDFGLGPSWSILHGQFTVDVCVFIAEAYEVFYSTPPPRRPTVSHCELSQRLGMLRSPPGDHWWQVSGATELLVAEVGNEIETLALPFLGRIASRRAFVEAWFDSGNDALGLKPRGDLTVAAVLAHLGDDETMEKILRTALASSAGRPTEAFYAEAARKIRLLSSGDGEMA